jgi:hypothetical protein
MSDAELAARLRVHLQENRGDITLANKNGRAYPLGVARPKRTDTPDSLHAIVDFLEVSRSGRYARDAQTYCNVYAYDYCYLSEAYLPRVWWNGDAIARLRSGQTDAPTYAKTVSELSANSLFDWFETWATTFGWSRADSVDELQALANFGAVAIVVAKNANPAASGHVNAILPETPALSATRKNGVVDIPVQSQAGATNFERKVWQRWWESDTFGGAFGFWHHP